MEITDVVKSDAQGEDLLFSDVCGMIDSVRKHVAVYVNSEICLVKWHIGMRIK